MPGKTRLDSHVDAPSSSTPGEAPHDTTDPNERATTVLPSGAAMAKVAAAGEQTVNTAVPLPKAEAPAGKPRLEVYEAYAPNGDKVKVEHNLDTGESRRV